MSATPRATTRSGSSPLTRGKRSCRALRTRPVRLIPAHAGKTSRGVAASRGPSAHPRSRGENIPRPIRARQPRGSSPLTRGKPRFGGDESVSRGLIPAHAGKTVDPCACGGVDEAHPRSRGENRDQLSVEGGGLGSSPLTRGKPGACPNCSPAGRLIPAHAGKTLCRTRPAKPAAAHPRSRGENSTSSTSSLTLHGSSPLTRGKPHRTVGRPGPPGLIPAHAGKTRTARVRT